MKTRLFTIHARSPIHCGTGQAVGGIDLPIAREKPTNLPLVPGSSIKGVLRSLSDDTQQHLAVFGPPTDRAHEFAGAVQFSDARLSFLPVRSVRGTFAWVTSPYLLRRLVQDLAEVGVPGLSPPPPADHEDTAIVAQGSRLVADDMVAFEDFDFKRSESAAWTQFAQLVANVFFHEQSERVFFVQRACLVHDDVMSVLLQTCTEITARIRLDPESKTVENGALWTEESLPVESLLSGLVVASPTDKRHTPETLFAHVDALLSAQGGALQLGGNASIGRGLCRVRLTGKAG